ncbi:electron transfer flavoprotein subunit alpha/FixB family protein [Longirhabdus pacifica]|uniref:electron transfer flavoprotein subunit alpha/FixB family protein n=1 Tax=Longirhabdus pacifica TaxID=2305227 RepID=UPI0010087025|nr:electron transfer flavoprotein subunit alpha/FixB family protein [Longirhabdus pacifica]
MAKTFLVIAEAREGNLRQISLEALGAAHQSKNDDDKVAVLLVGHQITTLAQSLSAANEVYSIDHPDLQNYTPDHYYQALMQVINQIKPNAIYFGHTAIGRDLAPKIAAELDAGQISDVTSIEKNGDDVLFTRPIYAGKAFETRKFSAEPWVVTFRPNNIAKAEASLESEFHELDYAASSARHQVQDVVYKKAGAIDLSEANVIISGGRGVKSEQGFEPLQKLADLLGGAVGASRGACDAEYCDYSLQIGQTGKVVTPDLYIACGISGAIQHLAGMSQSKVIVAVNKDAEAPIFQVADYGIVGDLFDIVPLLQEKLEKELVK